MIKFAVARQLLKERYKTLKNPPLISLWSKHENLASLAILQLNPLNRTSLCHAFTESEELCNLFGACRNRIYRGGDQVTSSQCVRLKEGSKLDL